MPGIGGWIVRLMGSSGGAKMTPLGKLFLATDKAAVRAHLHRLADLGPRRLFPGHGQVIRDDAFRVLRSVADAI
jgi:hypothetical protein